LLAGTAVGGAGLAAALIESNPVFAAASSPGEPFTGAVAARSSDALSFVLEVPGRAMGAFREISGLKTEVDVIEFRNGSENLPARKTSGPPTYHDVILSRPLTDSLAASDWMAQVAAQGSAAVRANCAIQIVDGRNQAVARYHLTDAWPRKVEIGSLKAGNSEELMETVTMTCEFIQRLAV